MKTILVLALSAVTLALVACDGGGGEVTCAVCDHNFTAAECMSLAVSHGCTSGTTHPDTFCSPAATGCIFEGCPAGEIMCTPGGDGGP